MNIVRVVWNPAVLACLFAGALSAGEPTRFLIIHADDAGMSHSVNRATIDAMERGIVSSASIMVPCPWFPEFAAYAKAHPQYDYGIHLTLNAEWKQYRWGPVAGRKQVPSLVDSRGFLWSNVADVAKHAKAEEVEIELRAQIDRAKAFGVPLSHLDTHMGALVSRPDLLEVYVKLGTEYNLPILFVHQFPARLRRSYPILAEHGPRLLKQLRRRQLPTLDSLVQFYGGEGHEQRKARYLETIRNLPPGVHQLIIHCGYDDHELQAITNSSARRDSDRRVFSDPQVARLLQEWGIQITTWKALRDGKIKMSQP